MPHGWTILRKSQACEYAPSAGKTLMRLFAHIITPSCHIIGLQTSNELGSARLGMAQPDSSITSSTVCCGIRILCGAYERLLFRYANMNLVITQNLCHLWHLEGSMSSSRGSFTSKAEQSPAENPRRSPWRYRHSLAVLISTWSKLPFTNSTSLSMVRSHS
jgi:hypothetical protein